MAAISTTAQSLPQQPIPFLKPHGVDPQDVPWLADLVSRQAVRLFDPRQLQELVPSVASGPTCILHMAKLHLQDQDQAQTLAIAIKQYLRPADLVFEVCMSLTRLSLVGVHTRALIHVHAPSTAWRIKR